MYSVSVRDEMSIAHSLKGETFGPAQNMHGATYAVDAEFFSETLNGDGVVIEMGQAMKAVAQAVLKLNYRCLDELPEFKQANTTTEFLARWIFEAIRPHLPPAFKGTLRVTLHESERTRASYAAPVA